MVKMTKMNMVWVAVAKCIYPDIQTTTKVTKEEIDKMVDRLFSKKITPVMITHHLVNSIDRQADKTNPQRGGSRNRYLVKDAQNRFRLYKYVDNSSDGWDKTGPCCPSVDQVASEFTYLVTWYTTTYLRAA